MAHPNEPLRISGALFTSVTIKAGVVPEKHHLTGPALFSGWSALVGLAENELVYVVFSTGGEKNGMGFVQEGCLLVSSLVSSNFFHIFAQKMIIGMFK